MTVIELIWNSDIVISLFKKKIYTTDEAMIAFEKLYDRAWEEDPNAEPDGYIEYTVSSAIGEVQKGIEQAEFLNSSLQEEPLKSGNYRIRIMKPVAYMDLNKYEQIASYNDNIKRFFVSRGPAGSLSLGLKSVLVLEKM